MNEINGHSRSAPPLETTDYDPIEDRLRANVRATIEAITLHDSDHFHCI